MMRATLTSLEFVPADIVDLFRCLLTRSEFDLWESSWKRYFRDLLEELKQTPQGAKDLENNNITYELLCGKGEWPKPEDKAWVLSKFILDKISKAADKAFNQLPTAEASGSFLDIKQSPSESFLQFIDRLRAQVERRVRDPKTKMEIVKEMAQRNANEVCSRVLLGLPLNPPPTLAEMMEACARKVELFAAREAWSRLKNPETVVAVSPGVRRSTQWTVIGVDLPEDLQNLTKDRTKLDITIGDPRLRRTIITW
ncbi:uncharacterized protein LOC118701556 isoform X1 [Molothrus ater]|uniref:uncharacterized protein LOC118701556 isoform X1 n=2 Tax=Molothrus ater TaxID=84834 RepID=UPI0023E843AB|nr:uncharacterized protein LOC118701556 isoform X1 [Molothrus ater]